MIFFSKKVWLRNDCASHGVELDRGASFCSQHFTHKYGIRVTCRQHTVVISNDAENTVMCIPLSIESVHMHVAEPAAEAGLIRQKHD
jgi:hypothetical protein